MPLGNQPAQLPKTDQPRAAPAQGRRLVSVAQSTVGVGATTETVYLLERR